MWSKTLKTCKTVLSCWFLYRTGSQKRFQTKICLLEAGGRLVMRVFIQHIPPPETLKIAADTHQGGWVQSCEKNQLQNHERTADWIYTF